MTAVVEGWDDEKRPLDGCHQFVADDKVVVKSPNELNHLQIVTQTATMIKVLNKSLIALTTTGRVSDSSHKPEGTLVGTYNAEG